MNGMGKFRRPVRERHVRGQLARRVDRRTADRADMIIGMVGRRGARRRRPRWRTIAIVLDRVQIERSREEHSHPAARLICRRTAWPPDI